MGQSLWKELFDKCDSRVGPTLTNAAKSEEFAAAAALIRRSRRAVERRFEESCRRVLRVFNLPVGSDVHRLLSHVAQLENDVRALRTQLADREHAEFLARLEDEHAERVIAAKHPARSSAATSARRPPRTRVGAVAKPGDTNSN